jgi:hypothetical protein
MRKRKCCAVQRSFLIIKKYIILLCTAPAQSYDVNFLYTTPFQEFYYTTYTITSIRPSTALLFLIAPSVEIDHNTNLVLV